MLFFCLRTLFCLSFIFIHITARTIATALFLTLQSINVFYHTECNVRMCFSIHFLLVTQLCVQNKILQVFFNFVWLHAEVYSHEDVRKPLLLLFISEINWSPYFMKIRDRLCT